MRPIFKFKYGKGRCPIGECTEIIKSIREFGFHLKLKHTYNGEYQFTINKEMTKRNNYSFSVKGKCGCGCGKDTNYPMKNSMWFPDVEPPFFLSGHRSKVNGPNRGTFKKGIIPWNTGTKGVCKPNSGSFQQGHLPKNNRGGNYQQAHGQKFIWNGERQPSGGRKYIPVSRIIMEKIIGRPLQRNEVVIHLDGDSSNDDPSNLKVISRGEHATRNRWSKQRERGEGTNMDILEGMKIDTSQLERERIIPRNQRLK